MRTGSRVRHLLRGFSKKIYSIQLAGLDFPMYVSLPPIYYSA